MLPTPLLQALFQQAQAAGQANNDIFNTPRADFSAGLPSAPIAPVVLPQQLGGRASGGAIDKALQNPMRQTEMAGNMETRAREKRAKEVGKTPGFPINEGTAWTTLGASALLRLLGADHNSVMGGVQNFLGGMQGLQNQREQARLAEVQGQFEAEMSKAQKLEQIANYNAKRVAEIEDRKERGRTRAAELILRASEAKNPAQATALLKEAQRIGGNVSREEIGGTLSRAGERMMVEKADEQFRLEQAKTKALENTQTKFRLNEREPFMKVLSNLARMPQGAERERLKAQYDKLQAKAVSLGIETMPDFDIAISDTISQRRQNDLQGHRAKMYEQFNKTFAQNVKRDNANIAAAKERIAISRQSASIRGTGATGAGVAGDPSTKEYANTTWNLVQPMVTKYGRILNRIGSADTPEDVDAELRSELVEVRQELLDYYNEVVRELGPDHPTAARIHGALKGAKIQVPRPKEMAAAIQRSVDLLSGGLSIPTPAGVMSIPPTNGGQASGQPGVPFRRGP